MKLHFTAWILTAVAWPGFGQSKAKEAGEGRASDAQLAAAYAADSFRAIPLKAVKESGMRIERLAVVLVAAATARAQHKEVTVHLVKDDLVPLTVLLQAERTATWLYAGIGVKLKWSSAGKDGVSMQFDSGLPEWFHPGVLGYSMPYAQTETRIHVLVDRLHVPV